MSSNLQLFLAAVNLEIGTGSLARWPLNLIIALKISHLISTEMGKTESR